MARDGIDEASIRQLAAIVIRFEPAVPAVRTPAGGREKSETDQARYDQS